ncbi:hypothetical protein KKF55_01530 [Patescibacteria group bacterium]|nr:hypothetical protein [Patescibacteria group bacterium]
MSKASSIGSVKGSLTPDEKGEVSAYYSLGGVDKWKSNTRGTRNRGFVLDDRYFLTIHGRKTFDQANAIARVANQIADTVAISRPLMGKNGYTLGIDNHPALITPKLPGKHHIAIAHTDKQPIPKKLHISLAGFFWKFQKSLSDIPNTLKTQLESDSVCNVDEYPAEFPAIYAQLSKYDPKKEPQFRYPDLTHDDMERCNILSVRNAVSGVVDLDSLRMSDVLYQFAHFLFNFALCDPEADMDTIDIYIDEAVKAGLIAHEDLPELYSHIYKFMIGDVIEFKEVHDSAVVSQQRATDIGLLVEQYDKAMAFAQDFWRQEFS